MTACGFAGCRRRHRPSLQGLVEQRGARVGRALERQGLLVADDDRSYLTVEPREDGAMETLHGHSITYRIARGPNAGRKVLTLQTVPVTSAAQDVGAAAKAAGFSWHAGVAAAAHEREKWERLCRYIARPAVSTERLSLTPAGTIRYRLKTPYRDGHDRHRVRATGCHGVFAPNSRWRAQMTPAGRGRGRSPPPAAETRSAGEHNRPCVGHSV